MIDFSAIVVFDLRKGILNVVRLDGLVQR